MEDLLTVENIANGAAFALFSFLALVGYFKRPGRRPQEEPSGRMEVAGALIDSTGAKAIIAAIKANTEAKDRNTDATERCSRTIEGAEQEIRAMTTELARGPRR